MKRFKSLLLTLGAMLVAITSQSAAEDVIITVKIDEALATYYKVEAFAAEMAKDEEKARAAATAIEEEGTALVEEFQDLREQSTSDILMEEAKKEAAMDAQAKMEEIQQKEQQLRQFVTQTRQQFAARRQQQLNLFYQEIAEVVTEISKERNATLVIDITALAGDGRAPVLYTDGSYDITPEVIERINATKGEEEEAPAAAE
ncbi:OmpH family outer membrane protein [Pelagicoccus mobilis]|uniref:OmpH family outer membrane protein n=1 Tax=Pelagicoccus mobilis TaxID=415221 RepID=A0A934VTR6_9BACT|nr:OmpH family outer membrane protein [Pelagicoccus mobilis]MBK1879784.1 OmpH family outer membrane protein [Pelagicoccus mobilis]